MNIYYKISNLQYVNYEMMTINNFSHIEYISYYITFIIWRINIYTNRGLHKYND